MNDYYWSLDMSPSYVEHYGILGMKWGVRNYQDKSGRYTAAGEARYADRDHGDHGGTDSPSAGHGGNGGGSNGGGASTPRKVGIKERVSDAYHSRVRSKDNPDEKTYSRHKTRLMAKYMKDGMSEEAAANRADQTINKQRVAAAVATTAVAAAATAVAVKKYKDWTQDEVLKDVEFQRLVAADKVETEDDLKKYASYMSYKPTDKIKYAGVYGDRLRKQTVDRQRETFATEELAKHWKDKGYDDDTANSMAKMEIWNLSGKKHGKGIDTADALTNANAEMHKLQAKGLNAADESRREAVKTAMANAKNKTKGMDLNPTKLGITRDDPVTVASEKKARDTFAKLFKEDAEFRNDVIKSGALGATKWGEHASGGAQRRKRYMALMGANEKTSDLKLKTSVYEAFNTNITSDHGEAGTRAMHKYAQALQKQGVNAIQDFNDQHQSRYRANKPIIVFPDEGAQYHINSAKTMSDKELNTKKVIGGFMIGKQSREAAAGLTAVAAGLAMKGIYDSKAAKAGEKETRRLQRMEARNNRIESMKSSGKTVEEIAKEMHMPVGTVASILYGG